MPEVMTPGDPSSNKEINVSPGIIESIDEGKDKDPFEGYTFENIYLPLEEHKEMLLLQFKMRDLIKVGKELDDTDRKRLVELQNRQEEIKNNKLKETKDFLVNQAWENQKTDTK